MWPIGLYGQAGRLGAAARPWVDREIRPAAPGRKGANVCTRGSRPTRLSEWTVDPGGAGRGARVPRPGARL